MSGVPVTAKYPNVGTVKAAVPRWNLIVWDDPINSLDYIAEVLHRHFGYPRPTCEALTLQVHSDGKAIIATGLRERVEADLQTLHDYGVQSTLERVT